MIVASAERSAWFQSAKGVTLTGNNLAFMDMIQPWVERAVAQVLGYKSQYGLGQGSYTEFLPAPGSERAAVVYGIDLGWDKVGGTVVPRGLASQESRILLSTVPVRSITSVYENYSAWAQGTPDGDWPATALLAPTGYRLDLTEPGISMSGALFRQVGNWSTSPRTVKVTYVAGYTQAEIDARWPMFKAATLDSLGWWMQKAMLRSQGLKANGLVALNLSIRDFSVTLGDPAKLGMSDGAWAQNILSPFSLSILAKHVDFTQYLG